MFKAVDRYRILMYFLASERSQRRLTKRELNVLESGADELAEQAAKFIALWRDGPHADRAAIGRCGVNWFWASIRLFIDPAQFCLRITVEAVRRSSLKMPMSIGSQCWEGC